MPQATDRQREIERSMRAHPAGRALPSGSPAVPAAGATAPPRVPLRLTTRGRRLLAVLAVAVGVGVASVAGSVLGGADHGGLHLAGQTSVVVRPGDTLWSLATSVAGDDDVRGVVDRIRQVNGLHGSDLTPGQILVLP
jgi:nucleoid-associated protein YgaU